MCGGIFNNHFTTNILQNMPVKNFGNRRIFGVDMDKSLGLTFLGHPVCPALYEVKALVMPLTTEDPSPAAAAIRRAPMDHKNHSRTIQTVSSRQPKKSESHARLPWERRVAVNTVPELQFSL